MDPDDGSYEYDFLLTGASGGLSLVNVGQNLAHVTGTTPDDQLGLEIDITCTVIDGKGVSLQSVSVTRTWEAPSVLTDAGTVELNTSADFAGSPYIVLNNGEPVDFYARVAPSSLVDLDDGSYVYEFTMGGEYQGLSMEVLDRNLVRITGVNDYSSYGDAIDIYCAVIDKSGNRENSSPALVLWDRPDVEEVVAEVKAKASKAKSKKKPE
ncbi:hypothetical protein [Klebsiella aerogenes]|uniref:hypothetical protein n=1 Tax=Klebsiella aerogenes TaxID=548 RepID=UPI001CC65779|nr:hypothetical protein [Klebsiella aerogenes]UNX66903.1 hypothetical protein MQE04_18245 [Klebsiella aerogenes]